MPIIEDIKSNWLNVVRRMQAALYNQQGYAIVSIDVIVDSDNNPVFWSEPRVVKLEPKTGGAKFLAQIIAGIRV